MAIASATGNLQTAVLPTESVAIQRLMPWVLSVLLHLGVALVAVFVGLVVVRPPGPSMISIPIECFPGPPPESPVLSPGPMGSEIPTGTDDRGAKGKMPSLWAERKHEISAPSRQSGGELISIIGLTVPADLNLKVGVGAGSIFDNIGPMRDPYNGDGGGGGFDESGIRRPGGGGGFDDVIFVIDRSGSMTDTFDALKINMLRMISIMDGGRRFHVIMFSEGAPLENGSRHLASADRRNKEEVANFLKGVICHGQTDPLPAIHRAFDVARESDSKRSKAVLLLTDGAFPDNLKVEQLVGELNRDKKVHVYTYVYGSGQPDPQTETVMKRIAQKNQGRYKYICPN
jgi:hypothetical protein